MIAVKWAGRILLVAWTICLFGLAPVAAAGTSQPSRKAAAKPQRVGGCEAYGAGFVRVQGSDTCVKIGGRVRVETWFTPSKNAVGR